MIDKIKETIEIKKWRGSNDVICAVEIECDPNTSENRKRGLAVEKAIREGQDLSHADLSYVDLTGADLTGAIFRDINFTFADFSDSNFAGADFTDVIFWGAKFTCAKFTGVFFKYVDVTDSDFTGAKFTGADFTGAEFSDSNFTDSDFTGAKFTGADFTGAEFSDSNFTDSDFTGARLKDAIGDGTYIKNISMPKYSIAYTHDRLQIGCENHTIAEWQKFSDEGISEMGGGDLPWWKEHKAEILHIIQTNPARPTLGKGALS